MTFQSINPYNGEVFKTSPELTDTQPDLAIATAGASDRGWKTMRCAERVDRKLVRIVDRPAPAPA